MMSFLALSSIMSLGLGAHSTGGDTDLPDAPDAGPLVLDEEYAVHGDLLDHADASSSPDTYTLDRGDSISGFDPKSDVLELEYGASLGPPDVTFSHLPGGAGVSVAMNGVVVTEVQGVDALDPGNVVLAPV